MKNLKFTAIAFAMTAMSFMSCAGSSNQTTETAEGTDPVDPAVTETVDPVTPAESVIAMKTTDIVNLKPEIPTFIDFSATWCGPCQQFKPIYHKVSEKYMGKAAFYTVDVDECPEIAKQFGVSSIPQITLIMPDGTVTSRVGSMPEEAFTAMVEAAVAGK